MTPDDLKKFALIERTIGACCGVLERAGAPLIMIAWQLIDTGTRALATASGLERDAIVKIVDETLADIEESRKAAN